ncbi:hypothetical protein NLJ89_g5441 [Agrocybe chaxingu]|uniref:Beta-xylanase n=1 Tax=Agrocybe chaxingu TaxID=84603 RepID=A0A9W8MVL1_9AGAR|nr:hypothetical protein NLJ89_g5441 [Agrocybe chaxingu]
MIGIWFSFTLGTLLIAGVTSTAIEENIERTSLSSAFIEDGVNAKFVARGKKFWGMFVYPDLLNKSNALPVIKAEIGAITAWDVVNEVLNEDGTLRRSVFSNVIGEAFITIAFQAARDADSSAKLYLNEYNILENNAKRHVMIALVNRINASSKLIDGLGAEVYANVNESSYSRKAGSLRTFHQAGMIDEVQPALTELASTGLEVAITYAYIPGNAPNDWAMLTKACLAVPSCVSLTIAPPEASSVPESSVS